MGEVCCANPRIYLRIKNIDGKNQWKCNNCETEALFPLDHNKPTPEELIEVYLKVQESNPTRRYYWHLNHGILEQKRVKNENT